MIDLNKMDKEAYLFKDKVHRLFDRNHLLTDESYLMNSFSYEEKMMGGGEFHGSETNNRKYYMKADNYSEE